MRWKSALTHHLVAVIRAFQTNKNLLKRICFPEGLHLFVPDKPEVVALYIFQFKEVPQGIDELPVVE